MQSLPEAPYKIKYPGLFASGDGAIVSEIKSTNADPSVMNYKDGVPEVFAQDPNEDGKFLELGMVNAIGKMASAGPYMSQIGYVYTYEPEIAEAIGGYAKGAVLRYSNAAGETVLVQSCKENNKANFVANPGLIDGENWSLITTEPTSVYSIFPDYSSCEYTEEYIPQKTIALHTDIYSYTVPYDAYLRLFLNGRGITSGIEGTVVDLDFYIKQGANYIRLTNSLWESLEGKGALKEITINTTRYVKAGTEIALRFTSYEGSAPTIGSLDLSYLFLVIAANKLVKA